MACGLNLLYTCAVVCLIAYTEVLARAACSEIKELSESLNIHFAVEYLFSSGILMNLIVQKHVGHRLKH